MKSPLPTAKKVAVLIPTFNRGKLLLDAISSIDRQSYKDITIFVYDDGSTENTVKLIAEIQPAIKRKLIYKHEPFNKGCGYSRNKLMEMAAGFDYMAWQDSDDVSDPSRIEKLVSLANNKDYDVIYSGMYAFNHPNIYAKSPRGVDITKYTSRSGLYQNMNGPTGFFKGWIGNKYKFDEKVIVGEDVIWITDMIKDKVKFGYLPEYLYYLRKHTGRTTFIYNQTIRNENNNL